MLHLTRAFLAGIVAFAATPAVAPAIELEAESFEGIRVLTLSGEFRPGDDPRGLTTKLATFAPDVVTFNSPGGSIYTAMEFGRALRSHGATTMQFRNFECASACALAFLGGVERFAEPGSIGVHKTSFVGQKAMSKEDAVSAVQSSTADVITYLVEMGIDPALLQFALQYESWDIRYLSGSEMAAHNVITGSVGGTEQAASPAPVSPPVARQTPSPEVTEQLITTADARSGQVRRPKGYAPMMAEPATRAEEVRMLQNGAPVSILGTTDRWYRVESGDFLGWMHHTWVKVDQFHDAGFEAKHVQVKSFAKPENLRSYLRESRFPLDAYLATNGWFAVTLDGTYTESGAAGLLDQMKATGQIPSDSFQSYGNTYMQKLCCE